MPYPGADIWAGLGINRSRSSYVLDNNIPNIRNSNCKDPGITACLECLRGTAWRLVCLEWSEQQSVIVTPCLIRRQLLWSIPLRYTPKSAPISLPSSAIPESAALFFHLVFKPPPLHSSLPSILHTRADDLQREVLLNWFFFHHLSCPPVRTGYPGNMDFQCLLLWVDTAYFLVLLMTGLGQCLLHHTNVNDRGKLHNGFKWACMLWLALLCIHCLPWGEHTLVNKHWSQKEKCKGKDMYQDHLCKLQPRQLTCRLPVR